MFPPPAVPSNVTEYVAIPPIISSSKVKLLGASVSSPTPGPVSAVGAPFTSPISLTNEVISMYELAPMPETAPSPFPDPVPSPVPVPNPSPVEAPAPLPVPAPDSHTYTPPSIPVPPGNNDQILSPPAPPAHPRFSPAPSPSGSDYGSPFSSNPDPPTATSHSSSVAVGLGVGLGIFLILVGVGLFCYYRRRKMRRDDQSKLLAVTSTAAPSPINKSFSDRMIEASEHNVPPLTDMAAHSTQISVDIDNLASSKSSSTIGHESNHYGTSRQSFNKISSTSHTIFTFQELATATNNFSKVKLLGKGGFGYVYKGELTTGKMIAVKQLKAGSWQGEREFRAEVETISSVNHRHLVTLVGYCISEDQRLLVYEFVPKGTLESLLHDYEEPLSWERRLKIAIGAAKGLSYLHEDCRPKIIHRDVKASNILVDDNFEAKVSDFGLARFCSDSDTHISTRVVGSFGYLAPEYASSGKLTEKSDIFSFGVVLLELITGCRPYTKANAGSLGDSMVEWAKPLLTQALELGTYDELLDPNLADYNTAEMAQMVACADVCVRSSARRRPQMSQIVRTLEGYVSVTDLCKEETTSSPSKNLGLDFRQMNKEAAEKIKKRTFDSTSGEQSTSGISAAVTSESGTQPSTICSSQSEDVAAITYKGKR